LVAAAKFLVAATKILFAVPNFVAITKPFFPCTPIHESERTQKYMGDPFRMEAAPESNFKTFYKSETTSNKRPTSM